jgi:hypothetical protein
LRGWPLDRPRPHQALVRTLQGAVTEARRPHPRLYRDTTVIITSWTDAPIPWPRCRALDSPGGGSGLLVCEELARAARHESAAAVMHWWGASATAVNHWRKALGVGRTDNEGTARLVHAAAEKGAEAVQAREWTEDEREQRRQVNAEKGWRRTSSPATTGRCGHRKTSPCSARFPTKRRRGGQAGRPGRCARSGRSWASPTRPATAGGPKKSPWWGRYRIGRLLGSWAGLCRR